MSLKSLEFRKFQAVLPDGEIIEEQIADDEIIMNSNDFRDSDEEIFEEDGQSSSSQLPDRYLKPVSFNRVL